MGGQMITFLYPVSSLQLPFCVDGLHGVLQPPWYGSSIASSPEGACSECQNFGLPKVQTKGVPCAGTWPSPCERRPKV